MSQMIDVVVVLGLLGLAVLTVVVTRMKLLPQRSVPYVLAAVAGAFGLAIFKRWRSAAIADEIKKKDKEIEDHEAALERLRQRYTVSDQKLQEMQAELQEVRIARRKALALADARSQQEKERIDKLSGPDLIREYEKTFGSSHD